MLERQGDRCLLLIPSDNSIAGLQGKWQAEPGGTHLDCPVIWPPFKLMSYRKVGPAEWEGQGHLTLGQASALLCYLNFLF